MASGESSGLGSGDCVSGGSGLAAGGGLEMQEKEEGGKKEWPSKYSTVDMYFRKV